MQKAPAQKEELRLTLLGLCALGSAGEQAGPGWGQHWGWLAVRASGGLSAWERAGPPLHTECWGAVGHLQWRCREEVVSLEAEAVVMTHTELR